MDGGGAARSAALAACGKLVDLERDSDTRAWEKHAAVWQDGKIVDLCRVRGSTSEAFAINGDGTKIVGSCRNHALLWTLKRG